MKRLFLAGAGGFGREALSWARDVPAAGRDWEVAGLLDDDPAALAGHAWAGPLRGSIQDWAPGPDDRVLVTLGDPRTRLGVAAALAARGARFATIVHPSAVFGENVALGEGVILCPLAVLTADVRLGDHGQVNVAATIGHDVVVGEGATLSAHVDLTGHARLGRGVFLGSHATVLPGVEIGDFARIGAGAVVLRRVAAGTTVFGNPARAVAGAL